MVAVAKAPRRNLLRVDPTRTTQLRLRFMADVKRRFETIRKAVLKLVGEEDAFGLGPPTITGLVANAGRWAFQTDPEKLASFQAWLKEQVDIGVLTSENGQMPWTETYIKSAYKSAAVRSYAEVRGKLEPSTGIDGQSGRARFLAESFDTAEAIDKIRLLSTRSYEQLRAVTAQMSTQMGQILGAGMAHGEGPRAVAKKMSDEIAGITKKRALVIARTEIIYAHSEGQLDSMERLGVAEVGVMVEWSTAGDDRVCELCSSLNGVIMTIHEARGIIPRHPNCRCAFIPANVGETKDGQKRSKASIQDAVAKSLRKERPKAEDPRAASTWAGADKTFADKKDKFTKGRGPLQTVKSKPKAPATKSTKQEEGRFQEEANTHAKKMREYAAEYEAERRPELAKQANEVASLLGKGRYDEAVAALAKGDLRYDIPRTAEAVTKIKNDAYIARKFGTEWGTVPGEYTAWRSGGLTSPRGVFFAIDEKGAKAYGPDAISYQVKVERPLVSTRLESAYAKLTGKTEATIIKEKQSAKDVNEWWRKLDKKVMDAAEKQGYDSIVYTQPAPPALRELVVFDKKQIRR